MKMRTFASRVGVALAITAPAFAAGAYDVSSVTAEFAPIGVAIGTIGGGALIVFLATKAWKWIKAAL